MSEKSTQKSGSEIQIISFTFWLVFLILIFPEVYERFQYNNDEAANFYIISVIGASIVVVSLFRKTSILTKIILSYILLLLPPLYFLSLIKNSWSSIGIDNLKALIAYEIIIFLLMFIFKVRNYIKVKWIIVDNLSVVILLLIAVFTSHKLNNANLEYDNKEISLKLPPESKFSLTLDGCSRLHTCPSRSRPVKKRNNQCISII